MLSGLEEFIILFMIFLSIGSEFLIKMLFWWEELILWLIKLLRNFKEIGGFSTWILK
jgi:hypothetical protein